MDRRMELKKAWSLLIKIGINPICLDQAEKDFGPLDRVQITTARLCTARRPGALKTPLNQHVTRHLKCPKCL